MQKFLKKFLSMQQNSYAFSILLILVVYCIPSSGRTVDTVIVGNGTNGPYLLGSDNIDSSSIRVAQGDLGSRIDYLFDPLTNSLIFSIPQDSLKSIPITYQTLLGSLVRTHYRYRYQTLDTATLNTFLRDTTLQHYNADAAENLQISGYKSIGIALGNSGQSNLTQALDVSIFGEIAPQTLLSAHLSDQGSSLDGVTREIGELDMIYITLAHPNFGVTVGDQYARWPSGGLLMGEKKIKGLSVSGKNEFLNGTIFGALSGGVSTVTTIVGRTGLQGPYFVRGNTGEPIVILSGTVNVTLNGKKLIEGEIADYRVDYEQGFISFSPRIPIADKDLISIQYEYKTSNYRRLLAGTTLGGTMPDSTISTQGVLWYESDDANHPLDLEISAADKDSLGLYGTKPWYKVMGIPIRGMKADSVASVNALYAKRDSAGIQIFVYHPSNIRFAPDSTYYQVTFRKITAGKGDYALLRRDCPAASSGVCYDVYEFVGSGLGDYTALSVFPTPARTVNGEVRIRYRPRSFLVADIDVAGQEKSENLFSSRSDASTTAGAGIIVLGAGSRRAQTTGSWAGIEGSVISEGFVRTAQSPSQRKSVWDDTSIAGQQGKSMGMSGYAGSSFGRIILGEVDGGRLYRNNSVATDRLGAYCLYTPLDSLSFSGDFKEFWHKDVPVPSRMQSFTLSTRIGARKIQSIVTLGDEWRVVDTFGGGHFVGSLNIVLPRIGLSQSISAERAMRGKLGYGALVDTGYRVGFEQRFDKNITREWNTSLFASHTVQKNGIGSPAVPTTLIDITSDLSRAALGLTTHQEYAITFERASLFVQEGRYVGAGFGDYTLDTLQALAPYVPKSGGSYSITNREWFDSSAVPTRVRKINASLSYSLDVPDSIISQGILSDLSYKGTYTVSEQVTDSSLSSLTFIPGVASIDTSLSAWLRYGSVSFRQEIIFEPSKSKDVRVLFSVRPFVMAQPLFREHGWELGLSGLQSKPHLTLGVNSRLFYVQHDPKTVYGQVFSALDRSLQFTQSIPIRSVVTVSFKEALGYAEQKTEFASASGLYVAIDPELVVRPNDKSSIIGSYTFASNGARGITDFRLARGYAFGFTQAFSILANVDVSKNVTLTGSYRGDLPPENAPGYPTNGTHVVAFEVKAYF